MEGVVGLKRRLESNIRGFHERNQRYLSSSQNLRTLHEGQSTWARALGEAISSGSAIKSGDRNTRQGHIAASPAGVRFMLEIYQSAIDATLHHHGPYSVLKGARNVKIGHQREGIVDFGVQGIFESEEGTKSTEDNSNLLKTGMLYAKFSKCGILVEGSSVLRKCGQRKTVIHVDLSKVEASVKNWKPLSPNRIRSFLGIGRLNTETSGRPSATRIPELEMVRKVNNGLYHKLPISLAVGIDTMWSLWLVWTECQGLHFLTYCEALQTEKLRQVICHRVCSEDMRIGPEKCARKEKETTGKDFFKFKERLKTARSRQKSFVIKTYALDFDVGERCYLKVSPWKGVVRFGKKGKLAPRYVGPFEIIEHVGPVAYRLKLPQELSFVHDTFMLSNLK
ncbi:hypothetical protein Tco_0812758 [Tanacetum coccineum]